MIRAAVLTAIMDDYDTLKPVLPQDGADVEWKCFTDSKTIRDEAEEHTHQLTVDGAVFSGLRHHTGWQVIYYDRPADEHPNRAAKRPKVDPGMYTGAPTSVWLDASFRVVSPRFVADTVTAAAESEDGIAQFRHPWRDCLFDEARESICLPKYVAEADRISVQAHGYGEAGMPRHWGLWATGVIAREHRADVLHWGRLWGHQIHTNSYQDQISHPFTLWRHGLRPVDLPGTHLGNRWLAYEGSGRH